MSDPTGIISGNVQQLASHLYTLLSGHSPTKIPENSVGFLMQYKNYCLDKTQEVVVELSQGKYPNGPQVVDCFMTYIVKPKIGVASGRNLYAIGPFLYTWLATQLDTLFQHRARILRDLFEESSVQNFKLLTDKVCESQEYCNLFLRCLHVFLEEAIDDVYYSDDLVFTLHKIMYLTTFDIDAKYSMFWKYMQAIFEYHEWDDNLSLKGFVFTNGKQLRHIRVKYTQSDPFETLMSQADTIHEVLNNIFHPGVDRIIMSYL